MGNEQMRKLPPLTSLKAFESAARHQSFTKAGAELCVTQGAISKQIQQLEAYLGVTLFTRLHQHIELTPEASIYLSSIQSALDIIEHSTDQLFGHKNKQETLILNILPSLSSRWLIPRLDDFKQQHPDIAITIKIGDEETDFNTNNADLAIRASKSEIWSNLYSHKLFAEELIAVCSPTLDITSPDELSHYSVLQHTTRPNMWQEYLASIGCDTTEIRYGMGFEHFFMVIQAACEGMGVALVPKILIQQELSNHTLREAFTTDYQSPFYYYLLAPQHKITLKKCQTFQKWLCSQI